MRNSLLMCSNTYLHTRRLKLKGVEQDVMNVRQLCSILNMNFEHLENENFTLESLENALFKFRPTVVWICGHGFLNETKNNEYLLHHNSERWPSSYTKITDVEFGNLFTKAVNTFQKPMLIVFDVCHSATFVNLEYYFYKEQFLKKVNSTQPLVKFNNDHFLVVISAATDFEETKETAAGGGFLTTRLIRFFVSSFGFFSLRSLDLIRPSSTDKTHNLIISVSIKKNMFEQTKIN